MTPTKPKDPFKWILCASGTHYLRKPGTNYRENGTLRHVPMLGIKPRCSECNIEKSKTKRYKNR